MTEIMKLSEVLSSQSAFWFANAHTTPMLDILSMTPEEKRSESTIYLSRPPKIAVQLTDRYA